ncbi:MAG: glycosyltransferase, partial [Desulfobacterota bacterium]|nr:glycosyltransferase [Thermodesulfobacteriota bacterium]
MQKEQSATINLIDVGAAGDLPDPWDKRRNLIGNILRFEPRERARQADNVISLAAMLWDKEEERNFYIYRGFNGSGSSLFLQNYEYVLQHYETLKKRGRPQLAQTWLERSLLVDVQRVQCRTLDSVLRELNLPFTYHFLKIDAQGAEYNILKGAEHYLKNDCYGLHLELFELPLYKDIKLFAEVAAYLEALGFELAKKYPAHGTFDSQHDCLFLKRGKDDPVMTAIRNAYDLPTARSQINRQSFVSHVPRLSGDIQEVLRISRERLEAFKNIHAGRRCVIIGNGPSLNNMDLSFLEHEICFGMNKIFLLFDRWQFRPTYYVAVNPLVIEQSTKEILNLSCPKFLSHRGIRFFEDPRDIIFIKSHDRWVFTTDPRNGLHEGWTVTYVALQLAYFMGFSEVVLIGVDHHFVATGKPNEEVVSQGDDPNHFHPDYFGKGKRWHLPDLERSERSYRMAKEAFEADGRRIIDATLGGKLNVFPKADYREVFGISRRSVALSSSSIGGTEGGSVSELFESVPEISSVSAPTVAPVQPPVTVLPVNQQFLERQREFWNVQSMYEAMFERVYVDPALKTLPLEQKIERWNKSAEISVGRVLSGIPSRPEWKVLEIGCGVGRLIKPLRERFAEVDGVDISENMIAFAHQYLADAKQNGRVMVNSGSDLKMFPDASYDFVFSMIVFQHIRSVSVVRSYFREICRVLKPGGYFKIQVHRAGSRGYGKADDEAEPEKQYGFFGNGYTAEDLNTLLEEAGLSVVELKPDGHWLWATAVKPARAGREHQYLVSAIVSTYNAERFIRGCLEDLVVQTLYQKGLLEIIVINSGSQENEETIVREFQMRHPHIVYFKTERETLYAAWNRGVQIARGKYLTTANTDDRHHPRAFERMAQALEDDPAIGLVYADSLVTRDENAAWGVARAKGVFRWPEFDLRLLYDICYMGPHPMWRASLHHEHGYFDESFVSAGDYEFWLRIASRGVRMRHIPETLGLYLERDTSVSLSNLDRTWKESERARSMHWPAAWGKKPATQWRSCEEPLQNAEALRQQRILICCDYFWPSVGGVEALVEDLGVRLRDKGYAVAFAVRHIPEREELVRHGITIHQFACNGDLYGGLTGDIQGYQQFLISSGFDRILVLSQPDNWVSLGLYQVREKISSKIIFLPSINRADIERWQRRGVQAEVEAVIRSADALVVVTEDGYDARYAAQNRIPAVYIPHSIDVVADPANFRTRHNLHPDKPLLAVVANFWPVKNHRELLRTLRTCNDDWQIVLIGNPVEAVKYCYEKACAEAARDSRVRILPGLPREQAAAAIRDADLLLVPSQAESAGPLVVLQAMQYGTPWIATPHCNGVYSEPGGVIAGIDKFPDVIRYLLGNPEIRRELGRQGKEGYAACFSWDKTLDAYVSLLENKSAVPDLKLPEALREQKWRLQDSVMQAVTGDLPAGRTLQEIQRLFPKRPVPGNKFGMIEVNGIKGFLEDKEMQQLYNRALNLRRGGMIIEIGSFMGLSASIMARALLESGNYNARIYCIDWWTAFKDRITPEYRPFYSVENFKANLFRTGIDRMVTVIDRKSPECAALFEDNCADMVFVDGDHSLQGCLNDLEAWYPKVKPGGVLIGHDYTWTESVRQAVHAFLDRHQLGSRFCAPDKGTSLFCIAKPPSETGDAPVFSVIIPTRNRSAVLEKCLAALAAQDFEPSKIEVIVCDDGSSDATEQVVQAFSAPWPLFYLRQERKGPAAARNLGIKTARGEYVLFLNDDAILDKHALAIHYQTHMARRGERIAVLGRFAIAAEYRQTPFGHLLDTTDILFNYAAKAADEYYNYNSFYTCNISLPRQAVIDAGMFDESFTAPAAEDIDLGYRLHQKGWRVFYKDTCIAFHDHKLKIADFCATHRMRGYWRVAMLYKYRDAGLKWLSDEDYRHIRTAVVGNAELEADIGQLVAKVEDEDRAGADAGTIKKKADELYPLVKKIQLYHEIQGYLSHPYYEVLFNPKYREAPLVSVVVPCYNHGAYLRECVESIVRQSFQNFEIIIVNDGSTDDSLGVARQLMREYPDHRIRILDQPHSGQPAIARNNGIAAALGKYILSLDADDWILPDALAGMVAAADARDGSEVVAYGYMQKFGVKNNVWPTGPCNRNILPRQNQLPNASLYRKSLWEKIGGYNQNVPGYEDWDFWIRASQAGAEFICLDRICIMYRTTESTSMLDRAAARHEHNVAHIIMNSPALYDPVEREWAANYLREFPEPPARQKPFDPNEAYAAVRASLIVHAFPGIYSEQEKAQAYRYLLQLANRRRRPVVTKTHDRRGNPIVAGRGNGTYKVLFVCHDFPP